MFESKFFTFMIVLTLLAVGAAVGFQALEMKEYNLFETLQARYFPASPAPAESPAPAKSSTSEASPAPAKSPAPAAKADAK